jgi:hypothetical protein
MRQRSLKSLTSNPETRGNDHDEGNYRRQSGGVTHHGLKAVADREAKLMTSNRLGSFVGLCAAPLSIALSLSATAFADTPSWNGEYAITFMVGPKSGTSMAVGDPEGQHTETYGFRSSCTSGKCVATIVSGPPPSNHTVPQPVQFTWDGSSWTQVSDFQWDCMMPDTTIQWSPARSNVRYTPQSNGTLAGVMHTDIFSGPCQGWIEMDMTAARA